MMIGRAVDSKPTDMPWIIFVAGPCFDAYTIFLTGGQL